ncbi:threonine-phosphate decarboxylase CobD [Phormidesmis sp. 146-33]
MKRPVHGGNLAWAAALVGCSPSAILDFSASISPLGPPRSAIESIQNNLGLLKAYPDPAYGELRSALSDFHQISPDWILPGNGAAELLTWAAWDLAALDTTWVLIPGFSDYFRALKAFGARVDRYSLMVQNGLTTLPLDAQKSGLLLNNPHNPTGQLFAKASILPYLKAFSLVVVDEAFMDFLTPDCQQSLIDEVENYPNLVILRSLTKFYSLPGLRLGYAIAHPDRLSQWQQRRDPWSVNVLASVAAIAMLKDTEFQQQTWDWLESAKPALFDGLKQLPGLHPFPSAANFFLVKTERSSVEIQKQLLADHKILIRDCLSFDELGDRYFRVAVRSESENNRLLEGLTNVL